MAVAVNLTAAEVAQIMRLTQAADETEAVTKAAREYLRFSQLKQLKAVSGKVDFALNWQELEALELGEIGFPAGE